jgi:hypothetical protein
MTFQEIVPFYTDNHTKHRNTETQNAGQPVAEVGGAYTYHWALKN